MILKTLTAKCPSFRIRFNNKLLGVRPTSHTSSALDYAGGHTTTVSSSSGAVQATTSTSTSGLPLPTAWGSSWDAPLAMNSINELLNPSRSFGPIGTDYGISTGGSSAQVELIF